MQIVLWPVLGLNLRLLDLTTYFVLNYRTIVLPGDTQQTTSAMPNVGAKLEAWRPKMFHNFHFLQSDMGFRPF